MSTDGSRRTEILETAATIFASAGFRASLQEIADACGILPGSLYHPFGSKGIGPRPDLTEPIWEYDHEVGKSITGGGVYRGVDRLCVAEV